MEYPNIKALHLQGIPTQNYEGKDPICTWRISKHVKNIPCLPKENKGLIAHVSEPYQSCWSGAFTMIHEWMCTYYLCSGPNPDTFTVFVLPSMEMWGGCSSSISCIWQYNIFSLVHPLLFCSVPTYHWLTISFSSSSSHVMSETTTSMPKVIC